MRRLTLGATLLALSLAVGSPAGAQSEAKLHYEQGVVLFQEENYKAALAEFLESYDAKPNWKLLHTIAVCYFNLNRFVEAKNTLEEYLEKGGDEVEADKRVEVEDMLVQISNLTAEIEIDVNIDGATIWIDDEKVATTPLEKPLVLNVGVYKLEITAAGYGKYKRDIKLAGGDKKVYDIALESKGGGVVTPPPDDGGKGDDGSKGDDGDDKPEKSKDEKAVTGFLAGSIVSGVLAAGGWGGVIAFGVNTNKNADNYRDCTAALGASHPTCKQYKDDGELYKTLTNVSIVLGSVFTAATAGLVVGYFLKKKKLGESQDAAFRLQVSPIITGDTFYLGIGGTF